MTTDGRISLVHEARSASSAERGATIAARATEEAEQRLDELHGDYRVFNFGGRDNTFNSEVLDEPPVEAKRTMIQSFRGSDTHGD